MSAGKTILVYADWQGLGGAVRVGTLGVEVLRGKEVYSFEYDKTWLKHPDNLAIDPALELFEGRHFVTHKRRNFGVFLDSSPDRWGQRLMDRRASLHAELEPEKSNVLHDSDYLLGVHDLSRMGGLRFKLSDEGPFLDNSIVGAAPPMARLRELEQASHDFEATGYDDALQLDNLAVLLAPGSSLGGARPKASVVDHDRSLWIAKFPSNADEVDTGSWEYLSMQLAKDCGISIPNVRRERFVSRNHTLLSQRFDRTAGGDRIHMVSAMTMLQREDGDEQPSSYLDIVDVIERTSDGVACELEQLWRRVLFNVLISNTDDHLRNHAFLWDGASWRLSPAYDLNPNPKRRYLSLNIDESSSDADIALVMKSAPYYRIDSKTATAILTQMSDIVRTWESRAKLLGISRSECTLMKPAFEGHTRF